MLARPLVKRLAAPALIVLIVVPAIIVAGDPVGPPSPAGAQEPVTEAWVRRYNGPGNGDDGASALAVDGAGNVYVTGHSVGSGTDYDYATIKHAPDGSQLWAQRYNGPGNDDDEARSIAVDASGNVYVTGYSVGSGTDSDYATIKYDGATGNQRWEKRYDGPGNGDDRAFALAVDGAGNVYVTGRSGGSGTSYDYATIKYDGATGNQLWEKRYHGPGNDDVATALAVDGAGNVCVTGKSYGGWGWSFDYATIKYDGASGNQLWKKRYNGPDSESDGGSALAVDAAGNVYVTGWSEGSGTAYYDYATIKYDGATGNQLWLARYNGPDSDWDAAHALAVDGSGNVYVTGGSTGSGPAWDYATIKYDGASGDQLWEKRYNGPANYEDVATALAVDGAGNVYVTGRSAGSGTDWDYATIKYEQGAAPTCGPLGVDQSNRYWDDYDNLICTYAALYDLPPELLKAVIAHEGWGLRARTIGATSFPPTRSYLYEPRTVDKKIQTRLQQWPGLTLPDNPPLFAPYEVAIASGTTAFQMCAAPLTAAFSNCGKVDATFDFVAQYRIAASYGVGQIVYRWHFDKLSPGSLPESLYDPQVNIALAAQILAGYKCGTNLTSSNLNFDDWAKTLVRYNSGQRCPPNMTSYPDRVRPYFDNILATTPGTLAPSSQPPASLFSSAGSSAQSSETVVDQLTVDLKGTGQLQLVTLTALPEDAYNFAGILRIYTDSTGQVVEWEGPPASGTTGTGTLEAVPNPSTGRITLQAVWGVGAHSTTSQFVEWEGSVFTEVAGLDETGTPDPLAFFSDSGQAAIMPDGAIWVGRRPLDAPLVPGGEIHTLEWNGATYELTSLCPDETDTDADTIADLCDTDDDNDGSLDWWEQQYTCVDPLVNDAAADPDADTLANLTEYGLGTHPCITDTDADGCADGEEPAGAPAPKPGATGAYDPLAWHDFYDVPVPAVADPAPNGPKNQAVTMGDVLATLSYFGACDGCPPNASGVDYDSLKDGDWNGDTVVDASDKVGLRYDRSPGAEPNPPWEAGPPDGAVTMSDVLAVLAQVGLSCAGPP